ncbi:MAG: hypothetical protein EP343_22280 [Deltaproteobacteria bacterium]|nr:MAG: hypothetical protein EP343_22280 [Deltaproteobacteria bacterium]
MLGNTAQGKLKMDSKALAGYQQMLDARRKYLSNQLAAVKSAEAFKKEVEVVVSCMIDPSKVVNNSKGKGKGKSKEDQGAGTLTIDPTNGACPAYALAVSKLKKAFPKAQEEFPVFKVALRDVSKPKTPCGRLAQQNTWTKLSEGSEGSDWGVHVKGIVYRTPAPCRLHVSQADLPVQTQILPIPQLGGLAVVKVNKGALDKERTLTLALHEKFGSLKSVKIVRKPIDAEAIKKLQEAVKGLSKAKQDGEQEKLEAQLKKLETQKKIKETKKAIEELDTKDDKADK